MRVHTFVLLSFTAAGLTSFLIAQAPQAATKAKAAPVAGSRTGGGPKGAARPKSDPTPRWPDGHPMLSAAPGKLGFWNAGTGGLTGKGGNNLPTNLEINEVPFKPWAKALYEEQIGRASWRERVWIRV